MRATKHRIAAVLALIVGLGVQAPDAGAVPAQDADDAYRPPRDCSDWRYGPDDEPPPEVLPAEYSRTEEGWKLGSLRDDDPVLRNSPQNQCGQIGPAVDLAWGVTTGRDDVVIAVLDSGIEWRNPGDMADLATKAYLNRGELTVPCGAPDGDCNGDGRFDINDFGDVAELPDRNGNGMADPEDLILDPAQNNGRDDDRNGYVDDISGWDFLYGDNNPLDTVEYGHGTGNAKDSVAAANGAGGVGTCPQCRFLPVRVGDSFIAEGGRFAAGVLFALDSRADVIQEALGVTSNPRQAQQAIDAAYERGVVVVASMADEASKHANLPAALENTMPVNSITKREHDLSGVSDGWLALNGCTNWGAITWVSVPSSSCSSEAAGNGGGIVGLVESAARDAGLPRHPSLPRRGNDNVLSANEVMQVLAAYADGVDFATPNATEPANNYGGSTGDLVPSERYPTRAGWDEVNGFGRVNVYEAVRLVGAGRIPPEAALSSPKRFEVLPTSGTLRVRGDVGARFADSYSYRVEWAVGTNPPPHPEVDQWHVVAERSGHKRPRHGELARIDLAEVAAALPDGGSGEPIAGADAVPDEDAFAVRVRVVVTGQGGGADGLSGVMQKQIYVHHDPDLVDGFPRPVPGASSSSPAFADLDGRGGDELILATSDGMVHAYKANGHELRGWPARTTVAPWWPTRSPTARAEHIRPQRSAVMVGAPAVADLDGDGRLDVVVTDHDGNVWAWDSRGRRLDGFGTERIDGRRRRSEVHINPDWSQDRVETQDEHNRTKPGFVSAAALGQLDDDPELEIVAAGLDRHVYAWNHDGTAVSGWPVLLVDPDKTAAVDPASHRVTFSDDTVAEGGEIIATPALADLDGDGRDEVIVGAQESYREEINIGDSAEVDLIAEFTGGGGNARLYALSPDGRDAANPDRNPAHPDDTAYLPGWPTKVSQLQLEALPVIGDGVSAQVAVGDVVPSRPGLEILAASAVGPVHVFGADGQSAYGESLDNGRDIPALWTGGLFGGGQNDRYGPTRNSEDIQLTVVAFGGASVGQLDDDGVSDFVAPTAGFSRMVDIASPDRQLPNDDQLLAWGGGEAGDALAGFPQVTTDLAFFVTPAIADLDGDGQHEAIAGNGLGVLSAHEADGSRPAGWPKLHGGWVVGTPGLGDLDDDGLAELAVVRRDGTLFVWHTRQPADQLDQWPRFGGNDRNTGTALQETTQ